MRLGIRIVVLLMEGKSVHRAIPAKNFGRSISLVYIRVHHQRILNGAIELQPPDGHAHIVDDTKALAMIRASVVKSAADVHPPAIDERALPRQRRSSCRQPY